MTELVYNRHDRKKLNKCFRDIFNEVRRDYKQLQDDADMGDDLSKKMCEAFDVIRAIANPSLDEKLLFLKTVAPEWEG